jgi:hypothetical protein
MDRETEALLRLAAHGLQFATKHPYATTGIFGAAVGSVVTFQVMTSKLMRHKVNDLFALKVHEVVLGQDDLRRLLFDPNVEIRVETPTGTLVLTSDVRERLRQLPYIDGTVVE